MNLRLIVGLNVTTLGALPYEEIYNKDASLSIYSKTNIYFCAWPAICTIEWGDSDIFRCDFISVQYIGDSDGNETC